MSLKSHHAQVDRALINQAASAAAVHVVWRMKKRDRPGSGEARYMRNVITPRWKHE